MKKISDKDEKLYEKFTIHGFFALSLWSFLFWFHGMLVYDLFVGITCLSLTWSIKSIFKFYLMIWGVLFFPSCLIPKIIEIIKSKNKG